MSKRTKVFSGLVALLATGGITAGILLTAPAANASTASLCGSGYVSKGSATVTDQNGRAIGTVDVTWNGASNKQANCVVFRRLSSGSGIKLGVQIHDKSVADGKASTVKVGSASVSNRDYSTDNKNPYYTTYAGPVYTKSTGCLVFDFLYNGFTDTGRTFANWGCSSATKGTMSGNSGVSSNSSSGSSSSSGGSKSSGGGKSAPSKALSSATVAADLATINHDVATCSSAAGFISRTYADHKTSPNASTIASYLSIVQGNESKAEAAKANFLNGAAFNGADGAGARQMEDALTTANALASTSLVDEQTVAYIS